METTEQISNESFSLNWLSNIKHSLDFLEESLRRSYDGLDGSSFIDMDPDFFSLRWTNTTDFNFGLPSSDASLVVHADQIFFNGHLLPMHLANNLNNKEDSISQSKNWDNSTSTNSSPRSLNSPDFVLMKSCQNKHSLPLFRENAKSTVQMLRKYLYFLIPMYKKIRKLKMSLKMPRGFDDSTRSPPRMSIERRRGSRVFDVASDCSILDAVLHCKKSIANSS